MAYVIAAERRRSG